MGLGHNDPWPLQHRRKLFKILDLQHHDSPAEARRLPSIASIQIGRVRSEGDPHSHSPTTRLWTSAFDKRPLSDPELAGRPLRVGPLGIEGDEVADTIHHGGVDKAILCYAAGHYPGWRRRHPEIDWQPGAFGENLTLTEIDETTVCIGDRFASDHCLFEVSQPRQPCWKISRRWGIKTLTKTVAQTGHTGWYVRVLQGGLLTVGETLTLLDRVHPDWTIARANDVMFHREVDYRASHELMNLRELAEAWKRGIA